jgi:uncharacterized protein YcnI
MKKAVTAAVAALGLVLAGPALGHVGVSPAVVQAGKAQEFTLTVPTEKEGVTTTRIELTPHQDFSIFSFEDAPGWKREELARGSGEERKIVRVTWSGGSVPTEHLAVFRFIGSAESAKDYPVHVRQTYSDGEVVDWTGPEDSDTPAPVVEAVSSFGGDSGSTLSIVALVVAGIGVLLAVAGLVTRGRPLA